MSHFPFVIVCVFFVCVDMEQLFSPQWRNNHDDEELGYYSCSTPLMDVPTFIVLDQWYVFLTSVEDTTR